MSKTIRTSGGTGRPALAVAGMRGGSGKTIVTLGLIRALMSRGFSIAPFKKGPDYIDPAWLSLAAGGECRNLDTFLMGRNAVRRSFEANGADADIAIVEGNRGLFDGYDIEGTHSFAEMVKLLRLPAILVVECTKSSRSVAAMVYGFKNFDKKIPLRGVILNRIAGERHRSLISSAIEKYCGVPVLGAIPRLPELILWERRLGLIPVHEHPDPTSTIDLLGRVIGERVDLDSLISMARPLKRRGIKRVDAPLRVKTKHAASPSRAPRIGVVRDRAFNFYYPENLEAIANTGARIVFINSLIDRKLPAVDALYIGGGFPENHAKTLSGNKGLRKQIRRRIEEGMPVYAECGGLIYLSDSIITEGKRYPMAGIFPLVFEIAQRPEGHGYTIFEADAENPFFKTGSILRGHEFRYARIVNTQDAASLPMVFSMRRGRGIANGRDGILYKNTLAAFSHTHALCGNTQWIESLLALAERAIP